MLQPKTPRKKLTLQEQRDMLAGNLPDDFLLNEETDPSQPTEENIQYPDLFGYSSPQTYLERRQLMRGETTPQLQLPSLIPSASQTTQPQTPQNLDEVDRLYQNGQITKDQADQYELLFSNGNQSAPTASNIDDKGRLLTNDPSTYNQNTNDPSNYPLINASGSDLGTELYSLGMAIGAKPGTKGRGLSIVGAGGAAALDIAGTVLSGIGFQKRNQYIEDFNRRKEQEVDYDPNSQSQNSNITGGLSYGKYGGLFNPSEEIPQYPDGGTTGNPTPPQKFYTYPGKPDALYKKVDNKWLISPKGELGDKSFVPVQDPSGSRYKELNSHAVIFKSQPYQTSNIRDSLGQDPGDDYLRKHPPIYISNNKDPRIGSYNEAGNIFLYKKPVQKVKYSSEQVSPPPQSSTQEVPVSTPEQQSTPQPEEVKSEDNYAYRTQWVKQEDGSLVAKQIPYSVQVGGKGKFVLMEDREGGYKNETKPSFSNGGKFETRENSHITDGLSYGKYGGLFNPSQEIPQYPDGGKTGDTNPYYKEQLALYNSWSNPDNFVKDTDKVLEGAELDAWYAEQIRNNPSSIEANGDFAGNYKPIKVHVSSTGDAFYPVFAKPGKYSPPKPMSNTPIVTSPTTPKQGVYRDANTGQPLSTELFGSPGQTDYQFSQYIEQSANSPEQRQRREDLTSEIEKNKELLTNMSEEQKADMRAKKMTPIQYFASSQNTPVFKEGGTKVSMNKNVGEQISFKYGGKKVSGVIKKIENGKIYL